MARRGVVPRSRSASLAAALGKVHVLTVGVSDYLSSSGFSKLKECRRDAMAVKSCFEDVFQLNADPAHIAQIVTGGHVEPSRGNIIAGVRQLSTNAGPENRILFFFSGHGQRLNDQLFLVPSDAWTHDDPDALIPYDLIAKALSSSSARQKIVLLDACSSGPAASSAKFHPAKISQSFFEKYLRRSEGAVVIGSSLSAQRSTTQSPDPQLSLFTYFLCQALRGTPEALDGRILTIHSLFQYLSTHVSRVSTSYHAPQQPGIEESVSNVLVLADFRQLLNPDSLPLEEYPVRQAVFGLEEPLRVSEVLTSIKRWNYSQEYLGQRVNETLGDHFREDFGRLSASLRREMRFSSGRVEVDDRSIVFPGGIYRVEYMPEELKKGKLIRHVSFEEEWFERQDDIVRILELLEVEPTTMTLELRRTLDPQQLVAGLEAQGWEVTSSLPEKIEAERSGIDLVVESGEMTFRGFVPSQLLGREADRGKISVAANVLALLGRH